MAGIFSHGRGIRIPPKVPVKTFNSATHTTEDDHETSRQEDVSSTTVSSNGRHIANPRSFSKSVDRPTLQRSAEQKVGILLPCFGEYKAQNAYNQRSRSADEPPYDSGEVVKAVSPMISEVTSPSKTPSALENVQEGYRSPPVLPPRGKQTTDKVLYLVPKRIDKPKLHPTRGTTGTYQLLPLPRVTGNPPRKPAMLPNVNLDKFSVVLKQGHFCLKDVDLLESRTDDQMNMQYDHDDIYEVPI